MDSNVTMVMDECKNYFARLCERVSGARAQGEAVTCSSGFIGRYSAGDVVRVHGAYTADYGDFDDGATYTVQAFDGTTLTLDRPLETRAPWLFVAFCEVPTAFVELCAEIAAYTEANAGREGLASESIDGYSWSAGANGTGWTSVFADRLKPYRIPRPTALYYARNAQPWRVEQ